MKCTKYFPFCLSVFYGCNGLARQNMDRQNQSLLAADGGYVAHGDLDHILDFAYDVFSNIKFLRDNEDVIIEAITVVDRLVQASSMQAYTALASSRCATIAAITAAMRVARAAKVAADRVANLASIMKALTNLVSKDSPYCRIALEHCKMYASAAESAASIANAARRAAKYAAYAAYAAYDDKPGVSIRPHFTGLAQHIAKAALRAAEAARDATDGYLAAARAAVCGFLPTRDIDIAVQHTADNDRLLFREPTAYNGDHQGYAPIARIRDHIHDKLNSIKASHTILNSKYLINGERIYSLGQMLNIIALATDKVKPVVKPVAPKDISSLVTTSLNIILGMHPIYPDGGRLAHASNANLAHNEALCAFDAMLDTLIDLINGLYHANDG